MPTVSETAAAPAFDLEQLRMQPVVDAHVHLWDLTREWYPGVGVPEVARQWLELGDISRMGRNFLLDTYLEEVAEFEITGIVHVSATTAPRAYLQETQWVTQTLNGAPIPGALIGAADPGLTANELREDLETQARSPWFRGVRVLGGLDPDSRAADELCQWLTGGGHVFDLVVHPSDVEPVLPLLARHPDLQVVVEHAAWADGSSAEEVRQWRVALGQLAQRPRTSCKISGIAMVTGSQDGAVLRPWIDGCLEAFGPHRCIFGSNFPVDSMYGSYADLVAAVATALGGLSVAERSAVFADNARRTYQL